jgi:hypothetical protein
MATNQSSRLTVGTFGVLKKLLDLIGNVRHLHKMILVEPINASFGKMIGNRQDSLAFELRGPPGMDKITIHVVALLTLASKIGTNFVKHVFWEYIRRVNQSVKEEEHLQFCLLLCGGIYFHRATRLFLLLTQGSLFIINIRGGRVALISTTLFTIEVNVELEQDAPSVNEVFLPSFLGPQAWLLFHGDRA